MAAAKRLRVAQSSSSGDTTILSAQCFDSPERRNWPSIVRNNLPENNHRPSIFSISFPVRDPVDSHWNNLVKFGCFLEKCFYCKKKLKDNAPFFMYSNLRAFCSDECRKIQIKVDEDVKGLNL